MNEISIATSCFFFFFLVRLWVGQKTHGPSSKEEFKELDATEATSGTVDEGCGWKSEAGVGGGTVILADKDDFPRFAEGAPSITTSGPSCRFRFVLSWGTCSGGSCGGPCEGSIVRLKKKKRKKSSVKLKEKLKQNALKQASVTVLAAEMVAKSLGFFFFFFALSFFFFFLKFFRKFIGT